MPTREAAATRTERMQLRMTPDTYQRLERAGEQLSMTKYEAAAYALTVGLTALEEGIRFAAGQVSLDEAVGSLQQNLGRDLDNLKEAVEEEA